jgi:hypothetical protein
MNDYHLQKSFIKNVSAENFITKIDELVRIL